MSNQTKQLTVADLEEAKERHEKMANINAPHNEIFNIAATCIGIVKEIVKCQWPNADDPNEWYHDANQNEVIDEKSGEEVFCDPHYMIDADHIVALHNIWIKAVAAFGGEVK